ncbi:hypothetical protein V5O48_004303 [Marasmius crinis-equi]|uniref:SET domain-containing protein n=1 Tax=Marasmius crinis-equi TaxID=585013 RepID=A0ABR3FR98_9AGAR
MTLDAELIKRKGNQAFMSNDFNAALQLCTHALKLDPDNGIYLLNRAFSYLKLARWADAEQGATDALLSANLSDAQKAKAFLRRGKARKQQGGPSLHLAREDFRSYLALSKEQKTPEELEAETDVGVSGGTFLTDQMASLSTTPARPFVVQGKGLAGDGAFATRPLQRGDLILEEKPLFQLGDTPTNSQLQRAVEALSPSELCQVLSLHNVKGTVGGMKGIFSEIYFTNVFAAAGLCILASKFNHACSPNARASFHDESGRHRIYALTDIAAGEEIVIPYIQGRNVYGSTRAQRRTRLRFSHGFECMCKTCSLSEEDVKKSDARRSTLKVLYEQLPLLHPSYHGEQIISLIIQAITLLREEGYLADADDFAADAAHVCSSVSDVESARYWARLAYESRQDEFGADSAHTIRMKGIMEDPMNKKHHFQAGMFRTQVLSGRL